MNYTFLLPFMATGVCAVFAHAEIVYPGPPEYTIDEYTILPSTITPMTAGNIEIVGSAGQADASLFTLMGLSNDAIPVLFEIDGGFWTVPFGQLVWTGNGGMTNDFGDPIGWAEGAVPTATDTVILGIEGGSFYNVVFNHVGTVDIGRLVAVARDSTDLQISLIFNDNDLRLIGGSEAEPSLTLDSMDDGASRVEVTLRNNGTGPGHGLEAGSTSIGHSTGSDATLIVLGPPLVGPMLLKTGDRTIVGRRGDGTLEIQAGAEVESSGDVVVGEFDDATGTVIVNGTGASWTTDTGSLVIGAAGDGNLRIINGASVMTTASPNLIIGDDATGNGFVEVDDSTWTASALTMLVGNQGSALVQIVDGEIQIVGGDYVVGQFGEVIGNGTIDAIRVVNSGQIRPGLQTLVAGTGFGALEIDGNYRQRGAVSSDGSAGQLVLRAGDDGGGATSDRLSVTGNVESLGGGLIVEDDGTLTTPGAALDLLTTTGSLDGSFNVTLVPGLPDSDKFLRVQYNRGNGVAGGSSVSVVVTDIQNFILGLPQSDGIGGEPLDAVSGDVDGDGNDDLVILAPLEASPVFVFTSLVTDGQWTGFAAPTTFAAGTTPSGIALGDIDGDGDLDIAVSNYGDDTVTLRTNDGAGDFTAAFPTLTVVGNNPTDVAIGDVVDQVGGSDVLVISEGDGMSGELHLFEEPSSVVAIGARQIVTLGILPDDIDLRDLDNDRDIDPDPVISEAGQAQVAVVFNLGGVLQPAFHLDVGPEPRDVRLADFDLNGEVDIVTANHLDGTVSVILNDGSETAAAFAPAVHLPVGANIRSLTSIDLEQDGDEDIVVVADDEGGLPAALVLRNDQNGLDPLTFTDAEPIDAGLNPVFVLRGDLDGDDADDLIALNGSTGDGVAGGAAAWRVFISCASAADLNGDGSVGPPDLAVLLDNWGPNPGHPADFNGNGTVGPEDLAALLDGWGPCQ